MYTDNQFDNVIKFNVTLKNYAVSYIFQKCMLYYTPTNTDICMYNKTQTNPLYMRMDRKHMRHFTIGYYDDDDDVTHTNTQLFFFFSVYTIVTNTIKPFINVYYIHICWKRIFVP